MSKLVKTLDAAAVVFPAVLLTVELGLIAAWVRDPSALGGLLVLLTPYLVPLGLHRLLAAAAPLTEGTSVLAPGRLSVWFLSYRLQLVYTLFPALEGAILMFPGLFSVWLRAWGSQVGRVTWASRVTIGDRGLLELGDDVFVGTDALFCSHIVSLRPEGHVLTVRRIVVEDGAFIGALCRIGPGVHIGPGARVRVATDLYPGTAYPEVPRAAA